MGILESYKLFYEQIPVNKRKMATLKRKPGRQPKLIKSPSNVLEDINAPQLANK